MNNGYSRQITLLILLLLVFAIPQEAFAYNDGKTGSSSTGCGGGSCHGGANTVTPSLAGQPSSGYTPGTVYSLTIGGSGGTSRTKGGVNLHATQGTLSHSGNNAPVTTYGEATHSQFNSRPGTNY